MLEPAKRWLQSLGLMTKTEFTNPWGVCDLVGCSLNQRRIEERLVLRQRRAIGPPFRVALLARIPDRDEGRTITLKKLQSDHAGLVTGDTIAAEVGRLVAARFVQVTSRGSFQKVNGWLPLHNRLVTVELKLSRVREALRQAIANRDLTFESYAAFPLSVALRVLNRRQIRQFEDSGVGVVGVTLSGCQVLLAPSSKGHRPDAVAETHCVERFWTMYSKGS
jgi:hypothetical protein